MRAVIYLRVASDPRVGNITKETIQAQRELCMRVAQDSDWQVISEYVDVEMASTGPRAELDLAVNSQFCGVIQGG